MRLNKRIRSAVADAIINSTTKERITTLKKREVALGDKIYAFAVGKHVKAMKALPQGWFVQRTELNLLIKSEDGKRSIRYMRIDNEGVSRYHGIPVSESRLLPSCYANGAITLDRDHRLADEARAIIAAHDSLCADSKKLRETLWGMLEGYTTVEKLVKEWPECEAHLPVEFEAPKRLPAVTPQQVNNAIACTAQGTC
ncbi:MAG: Nmad5 family putative nucleotide modification protein [Candidatus Sedimenticola sp. (ex Thyasira tokunagai)]